MPGSAVYGFDPNAAADGVQDADSDGYTNLEEFFNGTNPRPEDWSPSGDVTPPAAPQNLRSVAVP